MDRIAANQRMPLFLFSIIILILCGPAQAWWTEPNNTHYLMTLRSQKLLQQVNLLHEDGLRKGADSPDLSDVKQQYDLVRQNYDAALASFNLADKKETTLMIATAFHHLQDALDISTMFKGKYKDGIRRTCHDTLENWQEVIKHPDMFRTYMTTYNTELQIMRKSDLKQAMQRLSEKKVQLTGTMRSIFNSIEQRQKAGVIDSDVMELTKILIQCIATIQSAQDTMLEQFVYRYEGQ